MALSLLAVSTEYANSSWTADQDITGDTVELAFPEQGQPPATWYPAESFAASEVSSGRWVMPFRILLGPAGGAVTFEAGKTYDVFSRLTDASEVPVRKFDTIKVS